MDTYEEMDRGMAWVVFLLGSPGGEDVWVHVGSRGIIVQAKVDGILASGSGSFIKWEQLEQARQRATEMEEESA